MKVRDALQKLFSSDSPTYVNESDGTAGTVRSYTISPAEAAAEARRMNKSKKPGKK